MSEHPDESHQALKKVAEWVDFQKKITKWCLIGIAPFMILVLGAIVFFESRIQEIAQEPAVSPTWFEVRSQSATGNLEEALSLADELLARTPLDFEGHYRKGEILLMMGDRSGALDSFRKAAEIFPIPRHTAAVRALSDE